MADNRSMYVALLSERIEHRAQSNGLEVPEVRRLRDLAVSAVLQLEELKEEVHRLSGAGTHDPRTLVLLRNAARLIDEMRFGK